jgi:REP element-mobilizing transposase RayT
MRFDPEKHHRRSIRLKGYDYAQVGAYFLTIVAQDRACLFGEVADGEIRLNDVGHMVHQEWTNLPNRFLNIDLDAFIVMPNHIHGIIVITDVDPVNPVDPVGAGLVPAQHDNAAITSGATTRVAPTVGGIVGAFKSVTTVRYIHGVKHDGWLPFRGRLWQRNYYEHIIRDEESLNRIRGYIVNNPLQWPLDRENPHIVGATHASPRDDDPWRV